MAHSTPTLRLIAAALLAGAACAATAQDKVLNLYSARHYQTDEALYANFTKATGIKINRIDADDAGVITRLQAEGASSPADVVLLVDAARLTKAEADGLFQPVNSAVLQSRIPAQPARRQRWRWSAVVRLFDPRAGHRLQQGGGAAPPMSTPTKSWPTRRTRARCARAPVLTHTT